LEERKSIVVPGTGVMLTYLGRVARTGADLPTLWMASQGGRKRGVKVRIADVHW
jgi:hypothetical protein